MFKADIFNKCKHIFSNHYIFLLQILHINRFNEIILHNHVICYMNKIIFPSLYLTIS